MAAPTHLDLFSGIGGFALAAQWAGFRTIGFCEIDKYCQKVLAKNFLADTVRNAEQEQGHGRSTELPERETRMEFGSESPPRIHSNIFYLNGRDFAGVSLITGGFPCQPFSVAGKRRGATDNRAIWPQMFRVISEARPAWVLAENVSGIIPMELDNVLSDLEGIGYATRAFVIPACAVDARHRRDRVWIVGRRIISDADKEREQRLSFGAKQENAGTGITHQDAVCDTTGTRLQNGSGVSVGTTGELQQEPQRSGGGVSNSDQQGLEGQRELSCGTGTQLDDAGDYCRWLPESSVGRVAHGIPKRVDRLKGLGNAIVPQVAYEILREIRKLI